MKKLGMGAVLLLFAGAAMADGPFCVVTNYGQNCMFFDANLCRQAASQQRGMCVANQQPSGLRPMTTPNLADSFSRGAAEGQRQRIERDEHDARMELLRAQTEAAKAKPVTAPPQPGWLVLYQCPDGKGGTITSYGPVVGCIVSAVEMIP